ncbi:MAG: PTS sugar transporter subunit IIA [Candidatus Heimdallarchaeota archaeon]|nr:PTS sugar transporter subunit IIA [Candidatus Heimdallarchaeota archaeon]
MDIFVLKSKAKNKREIVHELFSLLFESGYVKETYEEAIHKRELEFPTALELQGSFNVAIPHAETEYVNKPAIAFGILENSIEWESMEDPDVLIPVHLVFLLAIKVPELVVPNLKALSDKIFSKPDIVAELRNSNDFDRTRKTLVGLLT